VTYWARVRVAVARGVGYTAVAALIAAGAGQELPHLPEPWAMIVFIGLMGAVVRAWPVVPNGTWWEKAWADSVLLLALAVAGVVVAQLALTGFAAVGAAYLAYHYAGQRRRGGDPLPS